MDKVSKRVSVGFSIILILGGIMGFLMAKSSISLITGLTSGIIVLFACNLGKKKPREAYLFIAAISLVLAIFFALKMGTNPVLMPNGLMLVISTTTFAVVGLSFLKHKKKK